MFGPPCRRSRFHLSIGRNVGLLYYRRHTAYPIVCDLHSPGTPATAVPRRCVQLGTSGRGPGDARAERFSRVAADYKAPVSSPARSYGVLCWRAVQRARRDPLPGGRRVGNAPRPGAWLGNGTRRAVGPCARIGPPAPRAGCAAQYFGMLAPAHYTITYGRRTLTGRRAGPVVGARRQHVRAAATSSRAAIVAFDFTRRVRALIV